MGTFTAKLRHASPAILTCLGIAGAIGTTVMAVKATPKALQLIDAKKDELKTEDLTPKEIVRTTWQCYIPSALLGLGTVFCIAGIGIMGRRNQAALTGAYVMLGESYKRYRQAAKEVYGEDADNRIHAEMATDASVADACWGYQVYNMDMDPNSERLLFYDLSSEKYFSTTMAAVLNAQYHVNRNIFLKGDCSLNEYLSFLGVESVEDGDKVGWDIDHIDCYGLCWLDFDNHRETLEDGLECIVIDTLVTNELE